MRHGYKTFTTPTAGNSVVLHDDKEMRKTASHQNAIWVTVVANLDQNCTIYHKWAPDIEAADGDLVVMNGTGSGDTAGLRFVEKYRRLPGRNVIVLTAGTPAPTATKIAVEYNTFDGALA